MPGLVLAGIVLFALGALVSRFVSGRFRAPLTLAVTGLMLASVPASAARTPGLDETRERVQELTRELSDAETDLSKLELRALGAETQATDLRSDLESLLADVSTAAIADFVGGNEGVAILADADVTAALRATQRGGMANATSPGGVLRSNATLR